MTNAVVDVGEACSGSLPCNVLDATMRDLAPLGSWEYIAEENPVAATRVAHDLHEKHFVRRAAPAGYHAPHGNPVLDAPHPDRDAAKTAFPCGMWHVGTLNDLKIG
jgi:hypothetical protein